MDTHVKRFFDAHERNRPTSQDEKPQDVGTEEGEIDQILADSFPASDSPPWTLGVTSARPNSVPKRKGH